MQIESPSIGMSDDGYISFVWKLFYYQYYHKEHTPACSVGWFDLAGQRCDYCAGETEARAKCTITSEADVFFQRVLTTNGKSTNNVQLPTPTNENLSTAQPAMKIQIMAKVSLPSSKPAQFKKQVALETRYIGTQASVWLSARSSKFDSSPARSLQYIYIEPTDRVQQFFCCSIPRFATASLPRLFYREKSPRAIRPRAAASQQRARKSDYRCAEAAFRITVSYMQMNRPPGPARLRERF